jgi:hypothetical protein
LEARIGLECTAVVAAEADAETRGSVAYFVGLALTPPPAPAMVAPCGRLEYVPEVPPPALTPPAVPSALYFRPTMEEHSDLLPPPPLPPVDALFWAPRVLLLLLLDSGLS